MIELLFSMAEALRDLAAWLRRRWRGRRRWIGEGLYVRRIRGRTVLVVCERQAPVWAIILRRQELAAWRADGDPFLLRLAEALRQEPAAYAGRLVPGG